MHDLVISLAQDLLEEQAVFLGSHRRGGGQLISVLIALDDILGRDIYAVSVVLVVIQHVQRRDTDIIFLSDLSGDIGGTVGSNDNTAHRINFLSIKSTLFGIMVFYHDNSVFVKHTHDSPAKKTRCGLFLLPCRKNPESV